jgi:hypothetical protein
MVLYVLNSLIIPLNFDEHREVRVKLKRITVEEAKELLKGSFVSAVGHEGTTKLLSELLGVNIPTNRITVYFQRGDKGIHFFLKERLPEGKVLSKEELQGLQFWLVLSEVEE